MNFSPIILNARIIENKELFPGYFKITVYAPELAKKVSSGQFFEIKVTDRFDIVLRRPLSIFDYNETCVSMLYEIVGKGTLIMSNKKTGEELDILGPLGNGYTLPPDKSNLILIGGGIGIASLYCWAKELVQIKKKSKDLDIHVLIGGKNKYRVLCEKEFHELNLSVHVSTDDGSHGTKGFITDIGREIIQDSAIAKEETYVYACGPNVMLKEVSKILNDHNVDGEVSIERWMGCGMGACLGCVVKTNDGKYKRACKEGPVFKAKEIILE